MCVQGPISVLFPILHVLVSTSQFTFFSQKERRELTGQGRQNYPLEYICSREGVRIRDHQDDYHREPEEMSTETGCPCWGSGMNIHG
jgi:hypothetical protein